MSQNSMRGRSGEVNDPDSIYACRRCSKYVPLNYRGTAEAKKKIHEIKTGHNVEIIEA